MHRIISRYSPDYDSVAGLGQSLHRQPIQADIKFRFEDLKRKGTASSLKMGVDNNADDTRRFVNERLEEYIEMHRLPPGTVVTEDLKKKITTTLIDKAQGM
jgi:hypothetical protein